VTLRKAIAAAATASLTLASACSTPPRAPDEGLKLRLELAANLLDVADVGMTLFATEVTKSYIAGEPGEVYLAKQMTRNTAVNNLRSLALGQDPTGALVDLYVWVRLAEQACANRNRSLPGLRDHPYDCHATYGELKRRIDGLMETGFNGKPVYSADLRAELDRIVVDFQSTHPDLVSAGLFRIDDLRDYSGSRMQVIAQAPEAMLSPVEDARAEIERARLVAAQMVWLASRLPTAAGWEAQSVVDELRQGKEVQAALASAANIEKRLQDTQATLAAVGASAGDLATSVRVLGERVDEVASTREVLKEGLWLVAGVAAVGIVALVVLGTIISRRLGRIVEAAFRAARS
jgi:hypothetical protein